MNKKWVTIGVLSVLVLGGGYWGYKKFTAKPVMLTSITAKAKMGDVSRVITATGTVNYPQSIPLQFSNNGDVTRGQVVELNFKVGDTVQKGQVLAKIDETNLRADVVQQQANLAVAQAKLQSLYDSYNQQTKAQARSELAKAQKNLTAAQQDADSAYLANQVTLANEKVKQASDVLAKAQRNGETSSIQSAQNSLNDALSALTTAKNAQNGGAAKALEAAQADVAAAEYKMNQQEAGPTAADIASSQANVTQARAQLDSVEAKLSGATIVAPTDAIIIDSNLQLYQYTSEDSKITITPSGSTGSSLEVNASIDQADIAQVKVGQKVDITLDAYADDHSTGVVSLVAPQGTTTSNVTTFEVTVAVEQASDKLRSGMNANIDIMVEEAKNVLTVPSEAVKTRGDKKGVMVPGSDPAKSGQTGANGQFVPVEFGLDDGENIEVKSGIEEGQEVITIVGGSTATAAKSSGGLRIGGGGAAAGGPPPGTR
ncbi:efflux RND transporter periplasmic adaptor subunit [Desulfosporosinus meridiei]|uniref:Multidrug resistance efflux pump n=1 Tax=Desulfosporosinus meridiei (strain ATCC BAA-275 / DSM 13257 / KCTC 12902 / NCIMB 13706 / S10) TaxID=768704 RepID=J7J561_DESMD|nr:HlyD family efflux transporter periplasmic adaptor subunit [Desulfosporosinus meridiei]AFQ46091.1 multidrug resistance efflux pump [Desulfosporosinus meridiei DSM 13257]